jgi:glycosyltransferase involved in cell wall biosynthesis
VSELKVAFVTQWYPPEPASPPEWIAHGLRSQGAHVEVLTGIPNYPDGIVQPGFRAWRPRRDTIDGISVQRAPLYPSHDTGALGRMLNYLSWAFSASLVGLRRIGRADVTLVYSSPATAAIPAMVGRWLRRTPYVLMIQDLWPDSVRSAGMLNRRLGRALSGPLNSFVALTYRCASAIVVTSPGMVRTLVERGVPEDKVTVVYNWIPESASDQAHVPHRDLRSELGILAEDFVVMYAGNIGVAQGLECIVDAVPLVEPEARLQLVFVGDGIARPQLEQMSRDLSDRVHFLGSAPRSAMPDLMSTADAQLVCLAADPLFEITTPSKLQAVMAAGHAVLAVAGGDAADIVRDAEAGLVASPGNPQQVADAVSRLAAAGRVGRAAMGRRGRAFYGARMTESEGSSRLFHVLQQVARPSRPQFSQSDGRLSS